MPESVTRIAGVNATGHSDRLPEQRQQLEFRVTEVHDDVGAAVLGVGDGAFGPSAVHVPVAGERDTLRRDERVGDAHASLSSRSGTKAVARTRARMSGPAPG